MPKATEARTDEVEISEAAHAAIFEALHDARPGVTESQLRAELNRRADARAKKALSKVPKNRNRNV